MKLSVWTNLYNNSNLTPEGGLIEFCKHGINYCELADEQSIDLLDRGAPDKFGAKFGKFANEIGMNVDQGHLFIATRLCDPKDREKLKRQIDLFGAIGIKNAVLHSDSLIEGVDVDLSLKHKKLVLMPGYTDPGYSLEYRRDKNEEGIRDLCEYVRGTDMTICLENMFHYDVTVNVDDILYFINKINSKNLGICLDTSHLNISPNPNFEEFITKAGKHLKALHVSDNDGVERDQHMIPYGIGRIDFVNVIKHLKAVGYDGLYNLEIPGERHAPKEIIGYKLEYVRKMFDYLDSIT